MSNPSWKTEVPKYQSIGNRVVGVGITNTLSENEDEGNSEYQRRRVLKRRWYETELRGYEFEDEFEDEDEVDAVINDDRSDFNDDKVEGNIRNDEGLFLWVNLALNSRRAN